MIEFVKNHIKKSAHRNELEKDLKIILPKLSGSILDVGSRNRRYDYLMKNPPMAIDKNEDKAKAVFYGDLLNIPFPQETFENVICLEVLEYVDDPEKAVSEITRVLTPEGKVILSVPFLVRLHEDRMRYTESYLRDLFSKYFRDVEIKTIGNFYTIIMDIFWNRIQKTSFKYLKYFYLLILTPFFLFIPPARLSTDKKYVSGYLVIASK